MIRCTFSMAAALALALPPAIYGSASPKTTSHSYVIHGNIVSGFSTARGGYAQARRLFGGPVSSSMDRYVCQARWPGGLTITFLRRYPVVAMTRACRVLKTVTITGSKWRTDRGLRIGTAERRIKRAYPAAVRRRIAAGVFQWRLVPGMDPALEAWVKRGRISSFRIQRL